MKSKLTSAITSVNARFTKGLNDDDQVARMVSIDSQTKGWTFRPTYDRYEITTDAERLQDLVNAYGYWSDQVKQFNTRLISKGGREYQVNLNAPYTGTGNGKAPAGLRPESTEMLDGLRRLKNEQAIAYINRFKK